MRIRAVLAPVAALGLLAACGDSSTSSDSTAAGPSTTLASSASSTVPAVSSTVPKPAVQIPASLPTELVVTDLTDGTGPAAVAGDTVVVNYVGVRSADGSEFDNSYDRGAPFPVTLGVGQVIKGWEQGLIGVKDGGRRQLDIPADLAYGDNPPSDAIQPGDALTFVIDVVAIIPKPDPTDEPSISIPPTPNQADESFTDLTVGDGPGFEAGQTVVLMFLAFSASDGKQIDSSWKSGAPLTFVPGNGQLPPGLEKAVEGMKIGGRRQVNIPFADAFGAEGNSQLGLPPSTDLIMVLDLIAAY
ncbi:MAG TPA: FKBP-type peptidyl-prolyl cis-trans isomerase [Ilumatobacteraceae bacterium]|nr:FKBP-type peptidyl-prolyl cis-trans isomerase [Ilumatobacteraceae bacterium]